MLGCSKLVTKPPKQHFSTSQAGLGESMQAWPCTQQESRQQLCITCPVSDKLQLVQLSVMYAMVADSQPLLTVDSDLHKTVSMRLSAGTNKA